MKICEKATEQCMAWGCPHGRPHLTIADCSHERFLCQRSELTGVTRKIRCGKIKVGKDVVIRTKQSTFIVYGDAHETLQNVLKQYGTPAKGGGGSLPMWLLPVFDKAKVTA